jgi:parallel beta-helix repeat protein
MLSGCIFTGNSAGDCGGGIVNFYNSDITLTNCIFSGNWARECSGAIYNLQDSKDSTLTLSNCTFSGNWAHEVGGISNESFMILINCIFWGNSDASGVSQSTQFNGGRWVANYNCIQGWSDYSTGIGNINADPCFTKLGYWADKNDPSTVVEPNDTNAVWIDGDYHLKSQAGRWEPKSKNWVKDDVTSPCIDAGDPHSPIGFEPFPNGGIINMGAYGGTEEASKSYFGEQVCETIVAGDINGDCIVNLKDFAFMAYHWLEEH